MSKKVKRLFSQFAPAHYDVKLDISDNKRSFSGSVTITGKRTGRPSQRFTLHQKGLKITNPILTYTDKNGDTKEIEVTRTVLHKSYDEIRLHTKQTLYPGKYSIQLDFTGPITKNMDGVYPCFFKDKNVEKQLIATQFESHHAREAFPCIDEPEAKATFQLTLTYDKNETALSNTLPADEAVLTNRKTTTFAKTPVMSTYLLAFVVGELEGEEAKSKNGVTIRTYATKDQVAHTKFALDVAVKCMDFYEDYYDIPFPLEKCDFVALPDFSNGAMENWGLITFREQALLVDKVNTSLDSKQYVAIVVAHELTHQWFGNLVTMRWWTDLWLNEGFASWMEYLAVDDLFPEWQLWTQFAVSEQQLALKIDALEHTHPIEVTVNHPDEIRTIFDAISYQKGASVIHMLHDYLGPEGFKQGLRHYLKTHAYKNTDTVDLWQALEDVTKKPVKAFMGSWTLSAGFPIINVDAAADHLKISQARFVTNPQSQARKDETLWPVPLLTEGLDKGIADKRSQNIPHKGSSSLVKLNSDQTGFYRVNYSHDLQQLQLTAIDKGILSDLDIMGLLSDSFEVTKAGYQPVSEFLDLMQHMSKQKSLPVWEIIAGSLSSVRGILSANDHDDSLRNAMKPVIRKLIEPQLERLGWDESDGEPHLDTLLRPIIIGLAASADHGGILKKIQIAYDEKVTKNQLINPNLRSIVYTTIARKGRQAEFDQLLEFYKHTNSSDEKMALTAGLTSFEQSDIHEKALSQIMSSTVRLQDTVYWIVYSFGNRHARKATWQWLKANWTWLKDNIGTDLSFSRLPVYAARSFADADFLEDYQTFFEKNMLPVLQRSYDQGVEIAQTNAAWKERDSAGALEWFKSQ